MIFPEAAAISGVSDKSLTSPAQAESKSLPGGKLGWEWAGIISDSLKPGFLHSHFRLMCLKLVSLIPLCIPLFPPWMGALYKHTLITFLISQQPISAEMPLAPTEIFAGFFHGLHTTPH